MPGTKISFPYKKNGKSTNSRDQKFCRHLKKPKVNKLPWSKILSPLKKRKGKKLPLGSLKVPSKKNPLEKKFFQAKKIFQEDGSILKKSV